MEPASETDLLMFVSWANVYKFSLINEWKKNSKNITNPGKDFLCNNHASSFCHFIVRWEFYLVQLLSFIIYISVIYKINLFHWEFSAPFTAIFLLHKSFASFQQNSLCHFCRLFDPLQCFVFCYRNFNPWQFLKIKLSLKILGVKFVIQLV